MIPVYSTEVKDGIADKVRGTISLAYCTRIEPTEKFDLSERVLANVRRFASAENQNQPDLFYFKHILVSTGWNLNDDVFDNKETWAARHTPEDKPFNYKHDCTDVIGHHTANYVIEDSPQLIVVDDNVPVDGLPERFHIVARAVLYKYWDVAERQERMTRLIAEIGEEKWFTSMEAWFRDFDYALRDENTGASKVVARNDKTAFLTKHLRVFGGDGVYQNQRVGRLLRGITFGGAGVVEKPANPDSVFLKAKSFSVYTFVNEIKTERIMAEETQVNELNKQLQVRITELEKQISENSVKANQVKLDELTQHNSSLQKKYDELTLQHTSLATDYAELQKQYDALKSVNTDIEKAMAALQDERKRTTRVKLVVEAYGVEAAQAEEIVSGLDSLSDESFTKYVESHKILLKKPEQVPAKPAEAKLDEITPKPGISGVVATDLDKANALLKQISEYMYGSEKGEK